MYRPTYGRYEVIERLGQGGMGIVYRGEDPMLDRPVAIKTLLPERLTEQAVDRFRREARSAAKLRSPHIVTIFDIGNQEEIYKGKPANIWYIVMEYVQGQTLTEFLQGPPGDPLELDRRLRFFVQVLEAMRDAHAAGVVHRDLKPDNVMVTSEGVVKVMDFGLAFVDGSHSLTNDGQMMGTPAYLSPEQAQGAITDHRTDIYSLGVILFETLTGRLPFDATHYMEMLRKVLEEPPRSPREFLPDVPPALERMALRCLRKSPDDRYQSVDEILAELELFLKQAPRPPAPPRPDTSEAPRALPPQMPFDFRSLESMEPQQKPEPPPSLQSVPPPPVPQVSPGERTLADTPPMSNNSYLLPFMRMQGSPLVASDQWMLDAHKPRPLEEAKPPRPPIELGPISPEPEAEGPVGLICSRCGSENEPSRQYCTECGDLLAPSHFVINREADAYLASGLEAFQMGRWQQATFDLQQALDRRPDMGEAHLYLGRALLELQELEKAELSLGRAVDLLNTAEPFLALADLYQRTDRFDDLIASLSEALRRSQDSDTRCRLAFLLQERGRFEEAIHHYKKVLKADPRHFNANRQFGLLLAAGDRPETAIQYLEEACAQDPHDAHICSLLARLYLRVRRVDRAQQALKTAIQHNQDNSALRAELGALYQAQNKEDLAFQELGRALDLDRGNREARVRLASIFERHGRVGEAVNELEEALKFHPQDLQIHRRLGELYLAGKDLNQAMRHFEEVVKLDPASAEMHSRLGRIYLKKNYTEQSIQEYRKAVDLHPVDPDYREDLGMAYYCSGQYDLAFEELRKASTLDGRNPDYPKALGMLKYELGDFEESVRHLKVALEKKPG
ncbi:MAG: tetratricopeptide repeat protein, partial [Candidatus Eremiobacterota bacterium]